MRYLYKCESCKKDVEVVKPMSQASSVEHCKDCNSVLIRIYTATSIATGDGFKK